MSTSKHSSAENNNVGEDIPNELLLYISQFDPKATKKLSQTNSAWKKQLKNKNVAHEEKRFFEWLYYQDTYSEGGVNNTKVEGESFEQWKMGLLNVENMLVKIVSWPWADVPYNWNFLPSLQRLHLNTYYKPTLPILPQNISSLIIDDSMLKTLANLPPALQRIFLEHNSNIEEINIKQFPATLRVWRIMDIKE